MPDEQARKNGIQLAFPGHEDSLGGLTKREYVATAALQGMLASDMSTDRTKANKTRWADAAVEFADALLERLERE